MKKFFLLLLMAMPLVFVMCGSGDPKSELEKTVASADAGCPVTLAPEIEIGSVTYENDEVTFVFFVPAAMVPEGLTSEEEEAVAGSMAQALRATSSESFNKLIEQCKEAGATIAITLQTRRGNHSATFRVPSDQL